MTTLSLFYPFVLGFMTAGYSLAEGCVLASIGIAISNSGSPSMWALSITCTHFFMFSLSYLATHGLSIAPHETLLSIFGDKILDHGGHIITLLIVTFFIFGTLKKLFHLHEPIKIKTNVKYATHQSNCGSQCADNRTFLERLTNSPLYTVLICITLSLDAFLHGIVLKQTLMAGPKAISEYLSLSYFIASLISSITIGVMVFLGIKGGGESRLTSTKKGTFLVLIGLISIFMLLLFNLLSSHHHNS